MFLTACSVFMHLYLNWPRQHFSPFRCVLPGRQLLHSFLFLLNCMIILVFQYPFIFSVTHLTQCWLSTAVTHLNHSILWCEDVSMNSSSNPSNMLSTSSTSSKDVPKIGSDILVGCQLFVRKELSCNGLYFLNQIKGHVNSIPTMQFSTGISRNTQ